ncbi:MAG: hypothetical protein JRI95_08765 [Deltaproteobacteria bacterium]|nr:hypothetical protein [Deltaproteobacteria bacterium]MBW2087189.1 hypothetical protein [Deltaproteobacteria bacterium]
MLFWGLDEGVGFNKFVGSGNEGDLAPVATEGSREKTIINWSLSRHRREQYGFCT